ncbi:MAG TPA: ABC-2 transporter permease, partial [Firmicutes bacterium]|nr:ABC-2 transporter permease [Bacillota bacterium]
MKGLIIKDFFALARQARIFLAATAFYLIYSITTKNITMFAVMFTMFMGFLPINTMAFDEQSKWNKYALSMPLTRTDIVLSKY